MRILIPVLILSLLLACKNKEKMVNPKQKISKIEYQFNDSSVPPPYHRSFRIVAVPGTISIVVDSYGTILTDTSFVLSSADFNELCDSLPTFNLKTRERKEPNGCVGGTGEQIKIIDADGNVLIEGSAYYCAGETYGTITGDLKGFGQLMKSKIPDFKKHLKE